MAIRAWNALADGHGGINWAGFDLVVQWLGVEDVDDLMHRLLIIKSHRPPDADRPPDEGSGAPDDEEG